MSLPHISPAELDAYLDDDQPTKCPVCQSRTQFLSQFGRRLNWCLNEKCQIIFMSEDEEES